MIIYENEELIIPAGIGPTVNTPTGAVITEKKTVTITRNGITNVVPGSGFNGLSECNIITEVPTQLNNQKINVEYTDNGTYKIHPDINHTGIEEVTVQVSTPLPTLQTLTVDCSTNAQIIVPDSSFYGLSRVNINPINGQSKTVTSTNVIQTVRPDEGFDALSYVTVAPINGQEKRVSATNQEQTITADLPFYALGSVIVNPIDGQEKRVSATNQEQTITADLPFYALGSVIVNPIDGQTKVVTPSTQEQTITPDLPYYALGNVIVNAAPTEAKTVKSSDSQQVVTPSGNNVGLSSVTVNPYILDDKTVDSSTNSQIITSSEDGLASVTINPYVLDNKTVDSSTVTQVITSDKDGLQSVTINPYVLESKTVNPSWVDQTITSSANKDGLSSVKVNKVTSDIDPNIAPNNIKLGVSILGVTGQYDPISGITTQAVNVDSSTNAQKITATTADYLAEVNIAPYFLDSKTVDASTNDQVVTSDVDGLSSVTVHKAKLQTKSINNYTNETTDISKTGKFVYIYPDTNYLGFNRIRGSYIYTGRMTVDASTNDVVYTRRDYFQQPPYNLSSDFASSYTRIKDVKVNKVTAAIDSNIQAGNIKSGVTILGVTGNFQGGDLTTMTVDSSSNGATYYVPNGYYGFSQFSVEPYTLQDKTVNASTISQNITADNDYNGLGTVTIKPVTASIDSDIKASNIKQGVTILGVNGSVVEAEYDAIYARLQAF